MGSFGALGCFPAEQQFFVFFHSGAGSALDRGRAFFLSSARVRVFEKGNMAYIRKETDPMTWVTLTRRTNDPKLRWLQTTLSRAGIPNQRNGESWHAPICEVMARDYDAAMQILVPVDDVPDDDPRWLEPFDVNPSGRAPLGWHL